MAKPYSSSHVGFVASSFTEMRLSGAVKESLVQFLIDELDELVPAMEERTKSADPDKKTLDDALRTRLNYNRTRELMIDRCNLDSVGSAAVQAAIEHLEDKLRRLINSAEEAAMKDRVNTIKPRHLILKPKIESEDEDQAVLEVEDDPLEGQVSGSVLTPAALRRLAKTFAGMPITDAAIEELILLYYDVVDQTGHDIRQHAQLGASPAHFIESLDRMKELMMMGWVRRMLKASAIEAEERGYKRIDVEQLINLDPFE